MVLHHALHEIEKGKLYGNFPTNGVPALESAYQEIQDVASGPYCTALAQVYADISNIVNDGHDESIMKRCYPGFIADCIRTAGEVQMELAPSLNEMISDRAEAYQIYSFLMLQYAKFGYYKIHENSPETQPYMETMAELEPIIDTALLVESMKERWDCLNQLLLLLWPYLREQFPKNGSPQNNSQTNRNLASPQQLQQQLGQQAQAAQSAMSVNPAPINGSGKSVSPSAIQNIGMTPGSDDDAQQLTRTIAETNAKSQIQNELDKAQMEAIRNQNIPLIHQNIKPDIIRHNPTNEQQYKAMSKEMAPIVRNLVKEMVSLLRELNEELVQHHLRFGPLIEATESYRIDNAFFAKKKLPADLPNMALSVLIDQSGSMDGEKLRCATKTAIMLEKFASELGIPIMIAGHDVYGGVNLRIFTDFVSAMTDQDRYAIAGIEAGGCNRDGLPLRICAELLAQRPEEVRLMIVISDGAPNDTGYRGQAARQDISQTVKEFRRKGLLIYGAAIDEDRDVIQEIYGKGFLSIQNLSALPKTLVRLVRQQII